MKLIIVRHGDPDYVNDTLTAIGRKEAALAAERIRKLNLACGGFKKIYVSPLGRARDTAAYSMKLLGRQDAVVLDWLKEFSSLIDRPDRPEQKTIAWDWLPQDWTVRETFYSPDRWMQEPEMRAAGVDLEYANVCKELDLLLADNGYVRCAPSEGQYYRVTKANRDTLLFFCHFGLESVLLSHLLHCSPMVLWHGFCARTTSVTTVVTEERRQGAASFRVIGYGDTSHLYAAEEEPSFSGRFCECWSNTEERHD